MFVLEVDLVLVENVVEGMLLLEDNPVTGLPGVEADVGDARLEELSLAEEMIRLSETVEMVNELSNVGTTEVELETDEFGVPELPSDEGINDSEVIIIDKETDGDINETVVLLLVVAGIGKDGEVVRIPLLIELVPRVDGIEETDKCPLLIKLDPTVDGDV